MTQLYHPWQTPKGFPRNTCTSMLMAALITYTGNGTSLAVHQLVNGQ